MYGLGDVDRWDGLRWYDPVFDRRHNVNLVASQGFDQGKWLLSARWNLGSGLPFTQSQGYYQAPGTGGGIDGDYLTSNPNDISIFLSGLNEGRLPAYHRLDLNVNRTWEGVGGGELELSAGITNVYSRENVFWLKENAELLKGRECGNGVVLRHKGGWETQYCHLKQGSVLVKSGQEVWAGQELGFVGQSGKAAFPHVHLSVRKDGKVVDPFDPDGVLTCDLTEQDTLWADTPDYRAGGLIALGLVPSALAPLLPTGAAPPDRLLTAPQQLQILLGAALLARIVRRERSTSPA